MKNIKTKYFKPLLIVTLLVLMLLICIFFIFHNSIYLKKESIIEKELKMHGIVSINEMIENECDTGYEYYIYTDKGILSLSTKRYLYFFWKRDAVSFISNSILNSFLEHGQGIYLTVRTYQEYWYLYGISKNKDVKKIRIIDSDGKIYEQNLNKNKIFSFKLYCDRYSKPLVQGIGNNNETVWELVY